MQLGGRALIGQGAFKLPNPVKLRIASCAKLGSQTTGDKLRSREGNNPDRQLRSQSVN